MHFISFHHFIYFERFAALHSHLQVILQGAIRGVSVLQLLSLGPQPTWPRVVKAIVHCLVFRYILTSDNSSVGICELKRLKTLDHICPHFSAKDVRDAVRSAYLRKSVSSFSNLLRGIFDERFFMIFQSLFQEPGAMSI